jgi:hypothetical protein
MSPDGYGGVTARVRIRQSPLDPAPDVPAGTAGYIEDEVDDFVWVDFGTPYGVVACEPGELQ